jgi:hypothetical protein
VQFVGDEAALSAAVGVVVEIDGCCKPWLGLAGAFVPIKKPVSHFIITGLEGSACVSFVY